jgi:hypothetical protein
MEGTTVFTVVLVVVLVVGAIYLMDPTLFGLLGSKVSMGEDGSEEAGSASDDMTEEFQDAMGGMMGNSGDAAMPPTADAPPMPVMGDQAMMGGQTGSAMAGFANMGHKKEGFQNNETMGAEQAGATMGNPNVAGDVTAFEGPAQFGNAEAPAGCYPRDQLTPSELLPKDPNSVWAQQNPMGTGSLKGKNFLSAGALIGVNTVGQSMRNANLQLRSEPPNPQMPVSIFNVPTIEPDINRRPLEIG